MDEVWRHKYDLIAGIQAQQLIDYAHPECLKISILREPVDRIISHYYFVCQATAHPLVPNAVTAGRPWSPEPVWLTSSSLPMDVPAALPPSCQRVA